MVSKEDDFLVRFLLGFVFSCNALTRMETKDPEQLLYCQYRHLSSSESESRNGHCKQRKLGHTYFDRTLITFCVATFLGCMGLLFSFGFFDARASASSDSHEHMCPPDIHQDPAKASSDSHEHICPPDLHQEPATTTQTPGPTAPTVNSYGAQCTAIPTSSRHDCWPQESGASQQACENKGCCWLPAYALSARLRNVPWCFYPSDYQGYVVKSVSQFSGGFELQLQLSHPSGWPNDIQQLAVLVTAETQHRLNFKIYDPNTARYEVPLSLNKALKWGSMLGSDYDVDYPTQGPFYITVTRKSTGKVLFSSKGAAPLVFADQFLQIGTNLSSHYLYGLGEHRDHFLISTNWTKSGFWSLDQPPSKNANLYGVHPFYLNIEEDNNAHGVFLLNSNAMEVEVQPAPSLTYMTIGGVLDFYIFTGPTSDNVVQQYTDFIGRPFMPPYWALGFHLCRWGYNGTEGMKKVIQRMREAQMPYDVQWNDIDYMKERLDWTYDSGGVYHDLPDVVNDLHVHGQHYIMIVDPGINNAQPAGTYPPYDDGINKDIFIKNADNDAPIIGKVWPGTTAFPDFFHPDAATYWTTHAKHFHDQVPFDGMWIDMNEPSNFVAGSTSGCPNTTMENPPFRPPALLGSALKDKTLCASARQHVSSHYNLHSMYGHSEAVASKKALDSILGNRRSIVISRSTFPGTGAHSGHWLGDNNAQWDNTFWSISGVLNFQLFGIPLVGADICGFNGNTNAELCARWTQLGAFYPFMRNHNTIGNIDQDPAVFDADTQTVMRDALNLRYKLLPYLYTLFYRSHVDGTTVARPLFFEFPGDDARIYSADTQFMWGSALLITPATSPQTVTGEGYLPTARWYDWFSHTHVDSRGELVQFALPAEHINLQVRGGSIIPVQAPAVTTTLARVNPFGLLVALTADAGAYGELYWDDGESTDSISGGVYILIAFQVQENSGTLASTIIYGNLHSEPMFLGNVTVLGVEVAPTSVTVNGHVITDHYSYSNQVLEVTELSLNLLQPLTISWLV